MNLFKGRNNLTRRVYRQHLWVKDLSLSCFPRSSISVLSLTTHTSYTSSGSEQNILPVYIMATEQLVDLRAQRRSLTDVGWPAECVALLECVSQITGIALRSVTHEC
ncbi:hypothetical protein RRG08_048264 [Elysia crispata]|uniref:Uncharacterized protein n=1 Tax=Elysia crispata TaxID=231223 RepID=A0AAE0ZT41_9GAST|nr:hypothetical protein RRG08_048264 [Elysia crispata]